MNPSVSLPFLFLIMLLVSGTSSCRKAGSADPPPPLRQIALDEVPAPAQSSTVLKPGMTLHGLGETLYGHGRFAGMIAGFNQIKDETRIPVGTVVKTPSPALALKEAGLAPNYQSEINVLAHASRAWFNLEPEYLKERSSAGPERRGTIALTPKMRDALVAVASDLEAAVIHLQPAPNHHAPINSLGQFSGAAGYLRTLASGQTDGYLYDVDMVGQHLGLGFSYLMVWVNGAHQ